VKHNLSTSFNFLFLMAGLLSAPLSAQQLPDFTLMVEEYGPAVVNISTTAKKVEKKDIYRSIPKSFEDNPFHDFFRHFFDDNELFEEERPSSSLGSGFIISNDGYIVSNNHVIDEGTIVQFDGSKSRDNVGIVNYFHGNSSIINCWSSS